jgi:hypothetical protein
MQACWSSSRTHESIVTPLHLAPGLDLVTDHVCCCPGCCSNWSEASFLLTSSL